MRRIKITDGTNTVTLLRDLVFTIQPKDIGATATMASGKTVMDIIGVKNELKIPTGPADAPAMVAFGHTRGSFSG